MDYNDENVKQAAAVVQYFVEISRIITKFTYNNALSLGLTLPQMGILNTIYSAPEITLKEITEKLQLSKSTASVNVDDLVNLGHVERKTSEVDRREIHLNLSTSGRELSKRSTQNPLSYKAMMMALEKLSEEDIHILLRIHKELLSHLQDCKNF